MAKNKRPNRSRDMDTALFEALNTSVPPKDTGPDPDDILAGLFEEDGQPDDNAGSSTAGGRIFSVELDEAGLARAQNIVDIIKIQTGEPIHIGDALKIALFCGPLESGTILEAFRKVAPPDNRK